MFCSVLFMNCYTENCKRIVMFVAFFPDIKAIYVCVFMSQTFMLISSTFHFIPFQLRTREISLQIFPLGIKGGNIFSTMDASEISYLFSLFKIQWRLLYGLSE